VLTLADEPGAEEELARALDLYRTKGATVCVDLAVRRLDAARSGSSWFHGAARVHWPEPTFRNFVAITLLALLASRPHAHAHQHRRRNKG
jgi:hypothetical protein